MGPSSSSHDDDENDSGFGPVIEAMAAKISTAQVDKVTEDEENPSGNGGLPDLSGSSLFTVPNEV
jgi:hypothetical protein